MLQSATAHSIVGRSTNETATDAVWIALRTRSRQEKAVARLASAKRVYCYLPLIDRVNLIRNRKYVTKVPLFPGYVFIYGYLEDVYDEGLSPRICQIISIKDQSRFSAEISHIQRALEFPASIELFPFAVRGRRCRVVRGPLYGVEGVVLDRKKTYRLIIQIDIVGQGVALEIDADMLEPVG